MLVVGTAAGQVLLYEPVATTGYVQDAESQATLVPFEALDTEDAEGAAEDDEEERNRARRPRADRRGERRQPARAERARVGWSWLLVKTRASPSSRSTR